MLLNTKKLAFLGILLSVSVLLIIFSGILEFNTMFLLGAASFCVGIAIREAGIRFGFGFYIAAILLSFMLAPNKLYCITFGAMGLYIVIEEFTFDKLADFKGKMNRIKLFWIIKYIAFNLMFIPILIFLPKLLYQGTMNIWFLAVAFLVGQIVLLLFDVAYNYFQKHIWGKIRSRFQG